jgi:hypothetical protein
MLFVFLLFLAFVGISSEESSSEAIGASSGLSIAPEVRDFDEYPLYWVGPRFERWQLRTVDIDVPQYVTFIYGTCSPPEGDGGCAPPLEIQVAPLCANLEVAARAPIWKRRQVRGAPVGTLDSAPVLFTRGAQVKVYRGEGSDPGLPWRVLAALHSANRVRPIVGPGDRLPPPPPGVLEGTRRCAP